MMVFSGAVKGLVGAGALAAMLSACAEVDPVLPGERLSLRAAEAAEEPGSAPIRLPTPRSVASASQSAVSPATRVDHAALGAAVSRQWSVPIGAGDGRRARIVVDPIVADGVIFTVDADNQISAISAAGAVVWQHSLVPPRDAPAQAQGGGLAHADGVLFVASGFGTLTAFDAATGAERWTQKLSSTATGAPSVAGGLVYVTVGDREGMAIEADTGRIRWTVSGAGDVANVAGAPAPAISGDRVVFGFGDGSLQTAFRQGGLVLWRGEVVGGRVGDARAGFDDLTGDPLIAGETVYAANHSGRMVAFDLFSGERRWTLDEGALEPVWPAGGSLFFVSDRFMLIRVRASDGAVIWRTQLPGYEPVRNPNRRRDAAFVHHGPVVAGGRLLVASSDGVLRAFAPEDGALIGQTEIPGGATTRPVVAGGALYVVSGDGDLIAYR